LIGVPSNGKITILLRTQASNSREFGAQPYFSCGKMGAIVAMQQCRSGRELLRALRTQSKIARTFSPMRKRRPFLPAGKTWEAI
jgi:hypothetical protein